MGKFNKGSLYMDFKDELDEAVDEAETFFGKQKAKLKGVMAWIQTNKIITGVLIIAVLSLVIGDDTKQKIADNESVKSTVEAVQEKLDGVVIPKAEDVPEEVKLKAEDLKTKLIDGASCEPEETAKIIQLNAMPTLADLLPVNSIVLDLSTFKLLKTEDKGDKVYTYYARYGASDEYYTVAIEKPKELIKVETEK